MKIKSDFITNSSSSSFILEIDSNEDDELLEYIHRLNKDPRAQNEGVFCHFMSGKLQDLLDKTNGREYDWVAKTRGLQFKHMDRESFNLCKEIIERKKIAAMVFVDYEVCEKFECDWDSNILL